MMTIRFPISHTSYFLEKKINCKVFYLNFASQFSQVSFSRFFGHGNGLILAILFFFCLFILENKLNYDDEIMVMQSVWYPLLCMVPGFIVCVGAKILLHFDYLAISSFLNIPYSLLAMYGFIIIGIVIPCSMINRSKKCKEFVLKKILTPLIICRNLQ